MRYKVKFIIAGHEVLVTARTSSLQEVLSCSRKTAMLFSECKDRWKIVVAREDGKPIMSYVGGNKPKPVYTAIDHVTKERKTYYTGA